MASVLLVSADPAQQDGLIEWLRTAPYQLKVTPDPEVIWQWLAEPSASPRLVLLHDGPPSLSCVPLTQEIKARAADVDVVVLADPQKRVEVLRAGAYDCLANPPDLAELALVLERAAEYRCLKALARETEAITGAAKRQTQQLEVLHQINRQLNSALKLDAVLQITLKEGLAAVRTDMGSIMLLNPVTEELEIRAWLVGSRFVPHQPYPRLRLGEGVAGHVALTGESYHCVDIRQDSRCFYLNNGFNSGSILSVPIVSYGRVLGTINADSQQPNFFTPEDMKFLAALAGHVAIAIESQRLRDIAAISSTLLPLDEMLSHIGEPICLLIGAESVLLSLEDNYLSNPTRIIRFPGPASAELTFHEEGLIQSVVTSGEPLIVPDAQNRARVTSFLMGAPLKVVVKGDLHSQCQIIGALFVHVKHREFSPRDLELMESVASQVAIALENAWLYSQEADKLRRLELLVRASGEIMGRLEGLSLDERLQLIAKHAVEILEAEACGISLVDRPGILSFAAGYGYRPGSLQQGQEFAIRSRPGGGLTGHIAYEGRLFNVHGEKLTQHFAYGGAPSCTVSGECYSLLAIPLKRKTGRNARLIGLLRIDNKKDKNGQVGPHLGFTQEDEKIIQLFADAAVVAIEGTELFHTSENARKRLKALYEEIRKVHHTAKVVAEVTTLENVDNTLSLVATGTREALNCDAITLYGYNPIKETLIYPPNLVGVRFPEKASSRADIPSNHLALEILKRERPYIAKNVKDDPLFAGTRFAREEEIASCMAIPLKVGPERVGVMFVNYRSPHTFTPEELANIELFANQAAVAIRNANLYQQTQQQAEHMAALHQVAVAANSTLDISEIFRRVLIEMLKVFSLDRGGVTLFDEEGGYGYTLIEYPEDHLSNAPIILMPLKDNPLVDWIMSHKQPLGITDALTDPQLAKMQLLVQRWRITSMLVVPLVVKEKVLGIITLDSSQVRRTFAAREITLAQTIMNQVATAVENAQLYDQEQKRIRLLQMLYEASRILVSSLELDEILNNIAHQAWRLAISRAKKVSFASIKLVDNTQIRLVAAYPQEELRKAQTHLALHGPLQIHQETALGITGRAIKTGQPQLVGNVAHDLDYRVFHPETRSKLAVPIKIGYQIIGAIDVEHPDFNAFDWEDQYALESLAAQAAIAIQNARLFKETERHADLLDAAAKVAREATRILDKELLLNKVVELIVERFDFLYYAGVFLLDEQREYALLWAAYLQDGPFALQPEYKLRVGSEGIVGFVAKHGRPHLAANVKLNPNYLPHPQLPETQAEIAFPLIVRGEVIGALDIQSKEVVSLKNEEIVALQTMADQLANAIHNAQQYEELKRAKMLVGARTGLAWLGMANSVWRHATDKHALTVREQIQLLRRNLLQMKLNDQKIIDRLSMIERLANKILEKPLTLPLTAEEKLEPIAINELISERAKQLWQNDPYRPVELGLELQLPGEVVVSASPEWLRRAFDILVDNAVNAVAEREIQKVVVGSRLARGGAEIFVADTGPGLPESIREKIGLEFIEKSEDAKGMGMGLLMAQTIVQTYGGEIRVEATGPGGTVMVLWLPLRK